MQDAENVAAPEAAEERAEPGQQQPDADPPPAEEPPRLAGLGAQEAAGGEDAEAEVEAEAGPGPEVPAEPAADGEEAASATPAPSPPSSPEERPAPALSEDPEEQARDAAAEARSDGADGEQGGAAEDGDEDEPSFSDPEDFVDDVSEEGRAAEPGCAGGSRGASPSCARRPARGEGFLGEPGLPFLRRRRWGQDEGKSGRGSRADGVGAGAVCKAGRSTCRADSGDSSPTCRSGGPETDGAAAPGWARRCPSGQGVAEPGPGPRANSRVGLRRAPWAPVPAPRPDPVPAGS